MSKVTRDFLVRGEYVTVIDVEAGIEHFGRGIEQYVDVILVVVDPTWESLAIAERVNGLARTMGIDQVWAVLNNVRTADEETVLRDGLTSRRVNIIGRVRHDPAVARAGLTGTPLASGPAGEDMADVAVSLIDIVLQQGMQFLRDA